VTGDVAVDCLALSPNGERVLSVSADGTATVWNAQTGARIALLRVEGEPVHKQDLQAMMFVKCAYSPEGKTLAVDIAGRLQIWDAQNLKRLSHTKQVFGPALTFDYTPDGQRLVRSGGSTEGLRLIEVPTGRLLPSNSGSGIGSLAFDGDSDVIAMTAGKRLLLIDRQSQRSLKAIDADPNQVHISVIAGRLIGVTEESKIQIWPIPRGGPDRITAARRAVPRCLTYLQRISAGLTPEPPRWCITGPDQVGNRDPTAWTGKWPYHTKDWKDWLVAKDRGERLEVPDLNEYAPKVDPNEDPNN
jgi:WD40 repeat protein